MEAQTALSLVKWEGKFTTRSLIRSFRCSLDWRSVRSPITITDNGSTDFTTFHPWRPDGWAGGQAVGKSLSLGVIDVQCHGVTFI